MAVRISDENVSLPHLRWALGKNMSLLSLGRHCLESPFPCLIQKLHVTRHASRGGLEAGQSLVAS